VKKCRRTKLRRKATLASDCRRSQFREEVSFLWFRRNTGYGRRNCFRRAPKELTRRNQQFRNDTIFALPQQTLETGLAHDRNIDSRDLFANKETMMRKLFFSIGAIVAAATAIFVWTHTMLSPTQASYVSSINPTELLASYTGPLPVENWDAF
jgi:hypothetical protein